MTTAGLCFPDKCPNGPYSFKRIGQLSETASAKLAQHGATGGAVPED
jgi:hypothetical protein